MVKIHKLGKYFKSVKFATILLTIRDTEKLKKTINFVENQTCKMSLVF